MFSLTVWVFLVVALLVYVAFRPKKRGINLPGPWQVPLIGSMLEFEPRMYRTFVKWTEKYGPLCKFRIASQQEVVLVGDPAMAKEMLAMDAFSGRAFVPEFTLFEGENRGLINSDGSTWEQQRRWVLRQLRDFGWEPRLWA